MHLMWYAILSFSTISKCSNSTLLLLMDRHHTPLNWGYQLSYIFILNSCHFQASTMNHNFKKVPQYIPNTYIATQLIQLLQSSCHVLSKNTYNTIDSLSFLNTNIKMPKISKGMTRKYTLPVYTPYTSLNWDILCHCVVVRGVVRVGQHFLKKAFSLCFCEW